MDFASRALGLGLSRMHRTLAARPPSGGRGLVRAAQPALLACLDRLDPDRLGPRCRIARRHIVDRRRLRLDACGDLGFEPDRLGAHGLLTLGATLAASSAARGRAHRHARGSGHSMRRRLALAAPGLANPRSHPAHGLVCSHAHRSRIAHLRDRELPSLRLLDGAARVSGGCSRRRRRVPTVPSITVSAARARRGNGMSTLRRGLALRSIDGGHGST